MNKFVLSFCVLSGLALSTEGYAQTAATQEISREAFINSAATTGAVFAGSGAAAVAEQFYFQPRFDSSMTVDQIVRADRTPSRGSVTIFKEVTAANVRAGMAQEIRWRQADIQAGMDLRHYMGGNNERINAADGDASRRLLELDERLANIDKMTDDEILKANGGRRPAVSYDYRDLNELRDRLEYFEKNHKIAGVSLYNRPLRFLGRTLGSGIAAGAITYGIMRTLNPASAAETSSDGTIPFADTAAEEIAN